MRMMNSLMPTPKEQDSAQPPFEVAAEVDARGLHCPLPILRTKKALSNLESGQLLRVLTTDKSAQQDFQAFCKQTGNALLEQVEGEGGVLAHTLRRR